MSKQTNPDFLYTFGVLQGGTVEAAATRMMADTAMASAEFGSSKKKGKLVITLEFYPGKSPGIMEISHKLAFSYPTHQGKRQEEVEDEQILFINDHGALTECVDGQGSFAFGETE